MNFTELLGPVEDSNPRHSRKVILWGRESLFADSVEFFLKTGAGWDVVKLSSDCGIDHLLHQVETIKPAVVILCQEKDASDKTLLMQLAQIQYCSKIVTVSLESNLIQVYSKHNLIMHNVSDLLAIIETRNFPNHAT